MSKADLNDKRDFKKETIKTIKNVTAHIFIDQYQFDTIFQNATLSICTVEASPYDPVRRVGLCLHKPESVSRVPMKRSQRKFVNHDLQSTIYRLDELDDVINLSFLEFADHGNLIFETPFSQTFRFNQGAVAHFSILNKVLSAEKTPQQDFFKSASSFRVKKERKLRIHIYSPNCVMEEKLSPNAKSALWLFFDRVKLNNKIDGGCGDNVMYYSMLNIKAPYPIYNFADEKAMESIYLADEDTYSANTVKAMYFWSEISKTFDKELDDTDDDLEITVEDDEIEYLTENCYVIDDCRKCDKREECPHKYYVLKMRQARASIKKTNEYIEELRQRQK